MTYDQPLPFARAWRVASSFHTSDSWTDLVCFVSTVRFSGPDGFVVGVFFAGCFFSSIDVWLIPFDFCASFTFGVCDDPFWSLSTAVGSFVVATRDVDFEPFGAELSSSSS